MCTPDMGTIVTVVNSAVETVSSKFSQIDEAKNNYKYRVQMAVNNANLAKNEALKQQQLGIEKSRQAFLEKSRQIASLKAKNASSNLDIFSSTNLDNYQDINDSARMDSDNIKNEYQQRANTYFDKANEYLNSTDLYKREYEEAKKQSMWGLFSEGNSVAKKWFEEINDNYKTKKTTKKPVGAFGFDSDALDSALLSDIISSGGFAL